MSLWYQFIGYVKAMVSFLGMFVTGMQLVLHIFAVCWIISLKLSLSWPTASTSVFWEECRHLTMRSAISSTCTKWKMQLPLPGIGKIGNLLIKQAMLLSMMLSYAVLPKIAQGLTIPHCRPEFLMCCQTFAFSLMQSKGESSEVCVWEVQTIFFTPASFAQSTSILEFQVTCSRVSPSVLSNLTQQVWTNDSQPLSESTRCFRSNFNALSVILSDGMFQLRAWLVRLTILAPCASSCCVTYLPVQDCAPVMAILIIKFSNMLFSCCYKAINDQKRLDHREYIAKSMFQNGQRVMIFLSYSQCSFNHFLFSIISPRISRRALRQQNTIYLSRYQMNFSESYCSTKRQSYRPAHGALISFLNNQQTIQCFWQSIFQSKRLCTIWQSFFSQYYLAKLHIFVKVVCTPALAVARKREISKSINLYSTLPCSLVFGMMFRGSMSIWQILHLISSVNALQTCRKQSTTSFQSLPERQSLILKGFSLFS